MRARLLAAGLACLPFIPLLIADPGRGQDKAAAPPSAVATDVLPFGPALLLPGDPAAAKKLQAARDYVAGREWGAAAHVLQDLLELPEDVFLPVTRRGPDGPEVAAVSLRAETDRLIAGLPRPGLDAYEELVGKRAARALADARGQPAALAAVVQRYPHTRAGAEAAAQLGAHHLDRGHFDLAAAYFDRLLRSAGGDRVPPLTLFQAVVAFRGAGESGRAEQAWKHLVAAADEVTVGDRTISLDELEKKLSRPARAGGAADPLLAETTWPEAPPEGTAAGWVADALRRLEGSARPAAPAPAPLVVGNRAVSRGLRGIRAVDLSSGALAWEAPSALSLDGLARDPAAHGHVAPWVEAYLASHPHVLLENSLLGTLSTDGRRVFAVEDLPVPPRPNNYFVFHNNQGEGLSLADAPELTDAVFHSRLLALDAASGKVLWSLGGRGAGPLRDCYFLGPPLPLGGRLYTPVQKGFDLRLLCLEPLTGEVIWAQTLAKFKARLVVDGGRRLHAVRPAFGDGLLVCPTHAGGVVAYDLVGRRLAWAHVYREEPPPPEPPPTWGRGGRRRPRPIFVTEPPNLAGEWQVSAPLIAAGKVVVAAADAPALCCLDLRDGSLLWQAKRGEGDLFVAGAAEGMVLVVGKGEVRALSLADGKPLWQCATAPPAGHGALAAGAYRLPVRDADGKAEVLTIDLARGAVTARAAPPGARLAEALPLPDGIGAAGPDVRTGGALVAQLGSDSYAAREAAARVLDAVGAPALDALRQAARSHDPEVSRRAAVLIRAIEKRGETAGLFEPQKLRLRYRDTPLAEAAADFARRSGVALKLPPELTKAKDRKVTLDTGDVTFWEAFDRFCAAAGLVEKPPPVVPPDQRGNSVTVSSMIVVGGNAARTTDILRTTSDERPLELTLADGKPVPRPTSRAGALRICALPPDTPIPHLRKEDGEALLVLDVAVEGRLQWQQVVGVRVGRALDEGGRPLTQLPISLAPAATGTGGRGSVTINGMPVVAPPDESDGSAARTVVVRLKQPGDGPAKKLKELTGTITAQVRTGREALVTVENVLKSAGRAVKGRHGGAVKVLEVVKEEGGEVRLKVRVEAVGRGLADVPPNPFGGTVIVNGRRLGEENLLSSLDFALLDDRGRPFRTVRAVSTGVPAGAAHDYELVYEPEAGQGEATRFVYTDRRTLFLDVPFTLKDVPLP